MTYARSRPRCSLMVQSGAGRRIRGSRPPYRTVARIGLRRSRTCRLRAPASRIRSGRIVTGVTIHAPDAFPVRSAPEFLGLSAEPAGSACHYERAGAGLTPRSNDNQGRLQAHVDPNEVPIHSRLWRDVES